MEVDEQVMVPDEVKGWNWGAFTFSWIWGIGNKTYLPLLSLIPFFGFVWIFIVGAKGNEWAWGNGDYRDVETFKAVQKTWNLAGLVEFFLIIGLIVLEIIFFAVVGRLMMNAYRQGY